MARYLCRVGYIGWNFRGTSIQPQGRTVEGEMERVLGGKVRFLSRTDAGVSAMNNYAICSANTDPLAVNQLPDVWLTGKVRVTERPRVFWRWYRYYYPGKLEVPLEVAHWMEGRHDFSSFSIPEGKNPHREIIRFRTFTTPHFTIFDIIGRSFLRQMVRRIIMGVVLHLRGEIDIRELLRNPVPRAVPPAPPENLVLMDVALHPKVPADEDALKRAQEKVKKTWILYRLRSAVLSNYWIVR